MFVIWGKKRVEKKVGYVAEFCPICRDIRPFLVSRVGLAPHIYYFAFNEGKLIGHVAECQTCRAKIPVNSLKYKALLSSIANKDIETLIAQTYPDLRTDYAERLSLEERIKRHEMLSSPEREALLLEPFTYLSSKVEEKYAKATLDNKSRFGCFGTIALVVLLSCVSSTLAMLEAELAHDIMSIIVILVATFGFAYTVIQIMLGPRRFVKKEIIPLLAQALLPLNPTQAEITRLLNYFKARGFKIGQKISDKKLWEALQEIRH
jgi:hypothetical protein